MKHDPSTYRHPRTLNEAFGPYADQNLHITEKQGRDWQPLIIIAARIITLLSLVVILFVEV